MSSDLKDSFVRFATSAVQRTSEWANARNSPTRIIRRFVGPISRWENAIDYGGLLRSHTSDLWEGGGKELTRLMMDAHLIRAPYVNDDDQTVDDFERTGSGAFNHVVNAIIDLVQRKKFEPSELDIAESFEKLVQPVNHILAPLLDFESEVGSLTFGPLLTISPFTDQEKNSLWGDELNEFANGTLISTGDWARPGFKIGGTCLPDRGNDAVRDVVRIVTALRLLKPGAVSA